MFRDFRDFSDFYAGSYSIGELRKMQRKIKLYMKCTTDKYELPIAVEENPAVLAEKLGVKKHTVVSNCCKQQYGYHRIEIEPEMWADNDGGAWYWNDKGEEVHVY